MAECIGKSIRRVDAEEKVTGKAKYAGDLFFEGMLYAKALRSSFPHARILKIEKAEAGAVPGVKAVLTSSDIPGRKLYGFPKRDHPVIASEKVRYLGEAIAIIGAASRAACEEAVRKVKVSYEELPAVFTMAEALKEDAPKVHEDGNIIQKQKVIRGDVEKGFSESDIVVEKRFSTPFVEHAYIEPESVVCVPQVDGSLTIYGSMQSPFNVRRTVCETLGVSEEKVRVVQAVTGGCFGGKDDIIYEMAAQAALVSRKTGLPCKFVLSREESFVASYKRHPMEMRYKVGAKRDGTVIALEAEILGDGGAYAAMSPFIIWRACVHASGPYDISNVRISGTVVYTNNTYTGPMRGFGSPQVTFAAESMMDIVSGELGIDPMDLRMKNALDCGRTTSTGQLLTESVGLRETIFRVREKSGWDEKRRTGKIDGEKAYGIGMACGYHGVSLGAEGKDFSSALCKMDEDGNILIASGITDYGTGSKTVFAQIASEVLGIPVEKIKVLASDTALVRDAGPTVASRGTTLGGNAMIGAALGLKERIFSVAADLLRVGPERLAIKNDRIVEKDKENFPGAEPSGSLPEKMEPRSAGASARGISLGEVARECLRKGISLDVHHYYEGPPVSWSDEEGKGDAYFSYSFGTQVAEVEVDLGTGEVKVLNIFAAHDVGKAINPQGVEGQIRGGAVMGMGYALYEEVKIENGITRTRNFDEYVIPTSLDSPDVFPIIVEAFEPQGPFGAKAVGEPPILPTAPAIANAVCAATGRRIHDLPMSLERVLLGKALRKPLASFIVNGAGGY
ncbi:MAG: xanthine dehydrogenase family protein molybdopterin-binding subunit [Candidatus Eisenbacteria bacterium]|nr:xanthine dehydrogenase family protein molybdopterin-binding subunit [Candidatus Eisenbacteria bacterium]